MAHEKEAFDFDGFSISTDDISYSDTDEKEEYEVSSKRPDGETAEVPDLGDVPPADPWEKPDSELPLEPPPAEGLMADDSDYAEDGEQAALVGEGEISIQVGEDEDVQEFSFVLPLVPGGDDQGDIEEPEPEMVVEEPEDVVEVVSDPWQWGNVSNFMPWLQNVLNNVPRHSGKDSAGIERAIAYLKKADREISRAVGSDYNGVLDINALERAREQIHSGIDRLIERLEKIMSTKFPGRRKQKRKKGESADSPIVKEAVKSSQFYVMVPLFISSMARTMINSMVSSGKDIEDVFKKLADKWKFTDREEAELVQLLSDMGYPIRRPRGYMLDEEIDYTSSDNMDWSAQYPA